jgi:hypothetical protein
LAMVGRYPLLLIPEPLTDGCEANAVQHHHRLLVGELDHAIVAVSNILNDVWSVGQFAGAPPVLLKDRCHARACTRKRPQRSSADGAEFPQPEARDAGHCAAQNARKSFPIFR